MTYLRGFFRSYLAFAKFGPFADDLGRYWKLYGGLRALFTSPLLLLALLMSGLALATGEASGWAERSTAIVPALMGFSLGAMALVLAFPTTKMFTIIAEGGRDDSYYLDMAAKFVHFFVVQTVALLMAVVVPSGYHWIIDLLGFWLLAYTILTGLAVALSLFGMARLYNHPGAHEHRQD